MNGNSFIVQNGPLGNQIITSGQLADATSRHLSGTRVDAISPYWGGAHFIYGKAGGAIRQFGLCVITPAVASGAMSYVATEAPNTGNLGRAVFVAIAAMDSGDYGWFMASGITPINCSASVAADTAFGIAAAGQGGAIANGKQILGGRIVIAASATVAKTGLANSGSYRLKVVGGCDGWFQGAYLSGTGVAAGATVTDISPDGKTVTMSAVSTAAINGTVTATYNNATVYYNVAHINNPIAQGQTT